MKLARILVVLLTASAFIFAQEAAPAAAPKAEKAAKKEAVKKLSGTVVSVDAIANTIIVKVKKGEDTLSVEAGAKITSAKKDITLGDIKADATVTITYKMVEGKKVATHISEAVAKAGKKKADKAAAAPAAAPAAEQPAAAPAAAPAAEPAAAPAAK